MKMIIVLSALVAVAIAAPQQQVVLVKETPSDNIGVDGYNYGFELSDGQSKQESAQLKDVGAEQPALSVRGSFSWVDAETNQQYSISYVADENGFQPSGAHIPV